MTSSDARTRRSCGACCTARHRITRRSCFLPCPHKSRFYEYHEPDKYGNAVETVTIN